jgi:hypothetical protein
MVNAAGMGQLEGLNSVDQKSPSAGTMLPMDGIAPDVARLRLLMQRKRDESQGSDRIRQLLSTDYGSYRG